jgi:uncharacterized protein (DUF697 family)
MADKEPDKSAKKPALKVNRRRRRLYEEPEVLEPAELAEAAIPPAVIPGLDAPGDSNQTSVTSDESAQRIIKKYRNWAMGLGLVPIPLVDSVSISSMQAFMIRDLARLYQVEFSLAKAQVLVASLMGGTGSVFLAVGAWFSFVKFLPVVGTSLGAASMPILAAAVTHAVGQVFVRHFSQGGSLDSFDCGAVGDYFAAQLKLGKKLAGNETVE